MKSIEKKTYHNYKKKKPFTDLLRLIQMASMLILAFLLTPNNVVGQIDSLSQFAYPYEGQPKIGPIDAEIDLDKSFPKKSSVFRFGVSENYFQWKEDTYDKIGLKIGFSYQMLFQYATETHENSDTDIALGNWWGFVAKWTPLNRGKDYEGSLVVVAAERGSVGNTAVPAEFGALNVGSLWATNFAFTSWPFAFEELYWEQWFKKEIVLKVGVTAAAASMNPFRFKDARTSFTTGPFEFHEAIPSPAQGPGLSLTWWPIETDTRELRVVGLMNDVNGNPNHGWAGIDFNSVKKGEFFYNAEIGYKWKRDGEFDQIFLDIFYADERSTRDPDDLPNEAGGGFKLMGSKQLNQFVWFGSYTYNTAEGGSTSVTFGRQTVTAGMAYQRPLEIKGELGLGFVWMEPLPDLKAALDLRNQFGMETYWKILFTNNLWLTPGFQFIWNPSLNPNTNFVAIPHIKFRIAY